ncbi:integrase, partial [Escherichia coli]|nr:integrase [Escherichia coli]EES4923443.1 integrase [Escherichia coli]EES6137989.1 integrase [Escherichia coli]EES7029343.1 integrase [Escherichia coli]EES7759938.1 integrase [Escherichia coli]
SEIDFETSMWTIPLDWYCSKQRVGLVQ